MIVAVDRVISSLSYELAMNGCTLEDSLPSFSRCVTNCFIAGGCNLPAMGFALAWFLQNDVGTYYLFLDYETDLYSLRHRTLQRQGRTHDEISPMREEAASRGLSGARMSVDLAEA